MVSGTPSSNTLNALASSQRVWFTTCWAHGRASVCWVEKAWNQTKPDPYTVLVRREASEKAAWSDADTPDKAAIVHPDTLHAFAKTSESLGGGGGVQPQQPTVRSFSNTGGRGGGERSLSNRGGGGEAITLYRGRGSGDGQSSSHYS